MELKYLKYGIWIINNIGYNQIITIIVLNNSKSKYTHLNIYELIFIDICILHTINFFSYHAYMIWIRTLE